MVDKTKKCFVICPIGQLDSETRKRSDDLLDFIIAPVVNELGYKAMRADKLGLPGDITVQIITELNSSDLIIADLTEKNANVFYELAISHALRKPVVHMIKQGESIPFDLQQNRVVEYDTGNYRMMDPSKEELKTQISNLLSNKESITNPFTLASLSINVTGKKDETGNLMIAILNRVESLGSELSNLRELVNSRLGHSRSGSITDRFELIDQFERVESSASRNLELGSLLESLKRQLELLKKSESRNSENERKISKLKHDIAALQMMGVETDLEK